MQKNFKAFTKTSSNSQPARMRTVTPTTQEYNQKVHNQLDWFRKQASMGYSDYNFSILANDFKRLSKSLTLGEYHVLGNAWRSAYTDENHLEALDRAIQEIKSARPMMPGWDK